MCDLDDGSGWFPEASIEQSKILLVEDDQELAVMISSLLRSAGYSVFIAENGVMALNYLEEVIPDLIISDILMPQMDGFEFRNHIWQDPDLQFVPFIFLTALSRPEDRVKGFELNADDYITKPFEFNEFLARVQSKLIKYRLIHNQIKYDSLTHIFSRRYVVSLLSKELERARRKDRQLSIAMIDLDNFKSVNDGYGHLVGDFVLNQVAQLLHVNMRGYDFVGRYGGEEFILVMPEVGKDDAISIMNRLRNQVSTASLSEHAIKITLSGGIATTPEDGFEAKVLLYKADQALYRAKEKGKNLIEAFPFSP